MPWSNHHGELLNHRTLQPTIKFYFVPYLPPSDGWFTVLHDPAQPTFDIRSNELVCISKLTHSSFGIYFTRVHRWQHPHRKHWPPQSQAGHTSLGSFPNILCIFSSFPKILCIFSSFPLCNTIIMYYRKSSLERALSMPDSSTPRSIKSITWMSIIDPSSYPQTQPHIQVLLKFEWILFKILRILTTWTAASQASQARSLSSGETLDTWIFFSGKDIQL